MPENVEQWWARRQRSKNAEVPYPIGSYRSDWERYPVLIRQYHPDLNHGITLTQVPPAADVYLVWQCDAGHQFVATPEEQRQRPGASRRRSTWCPDCAGLAVPQRVRPAGAAAGAAAVAVAPARKPPRVRECGHPLGPSRQRTLSSGRTTDGGCIICRNARAAADRFAVGDAFASPWAPPPASAAEADLRKRLGERLPLDATLNAVKVARPFFNHIEVWPDIPLPDLRVAIEYDTTGRDGLEHVGRREEIDRRKDRLLRAAGWEVVRIRCGKLQPIGPWDLTAAGVSATLVDRLVDRLSEIRGDLIVRSYLVG